MRRTGEGAKDEYIIFLTPKEEVAHVEEDDTLRQVVEKLEYHGYSAIPLLALDGKYIGTITEGDLLWEMKEKIFRMSIAWKKSELQM